jgi:hypothetical protein
LTPHERRVFVTVALIGVQLVVLAERSRTRPQSSEATVKTTKPLEKTLRFSGTRRSGRPPLRGAASPPAE